jgi:hypothetical protein
MFSVQEFSGLIQSSQADRGGGDDGTRNIESPGSKAFPQKPSGRVSKRHRVAASRRVKIYYVVDVK